MYTTSYRNWYSRVKIGGKRLALTGTVKARESLEGVTTSIAEFSLSQKNGVKYQRNLNVNIDHIKRDADGGVHKKRKVFEGRVDIVHGASFPNEIIITAAGVLSNLRLTPNRCIDLSGKTDREAAQMILRECGVPFDRNKIKGSDYVLGERAPVIWDDGASGASMITELDTIFGYATIENGEGKAQRVKYSRVPRDYSGNVPEYRTYRRGHSDVQFYDNDRERGHRDEVINYWKITGLEYEVGNPNHDSDGDGIESEGNEGCTRRIWASCHDINHKLLGKGVYVYGELASDIIQSPRLAKALCRRQLEWYNREVDTVSLETANEPRTRVGQIMRVKDEAKGVDLDEREKYLILNIQRDGDVMTVDGVGGDAGDVSHVSGGIEECCGTWEEDGACHEQCIPNEMDDTVEPPPLPDLPDLPDEPADDFCDPGVDPTCIPNTPVELESVGAATCSPITMVGVSSASVLDGGTSTPGTGGTDLNGVIGGEGSVGSPVGTIPQGQITGGGDWAMVNQWDALILQAVADHPGADAAFLKSMMIVESGGYEAATDSFGAVGLMQIKPEFWDTEALSLGYDLHTPEGQIGMAAAIIGGDTAETAGMDMQTAFLTVYYPVYDDDMNLCLTCYGESGHTPQMYLNDIALFTSVMVAAQGSTTLDGVGTHDLPSVTPDIGTCDAPGWNAVDGTCQVARYFTGEDGIWAYVDADGNVARMGTVADPGEPLDRFTTRFTRSQTTVTTPEETDPNRYFKVSCTGQVCVQGGARFATAGSSIRFFLDGWTSEQLSNGDTTPSQPEAASVTLYATPGLTVARPYCDSNPSDAFGWVLSHHGNTPVLSGCGTTPGVGTTAFENNNGGYGGDGAPLNTDLSFRVCWDMDDPDLKATVFGSWGEGEAVYNPYLAGLGNSGAGCPSDFHAVGLEVIGLNPEGVTDGDPVTQVWDVLLTGDTAGVGTCFEGDDAAAAGFTINPRVFEWSGFSEYGDAQIGTSTIDAIKVGETFFTPPDDEWTSGVSGNFDLRCYTWVKPLEQSIEAYYNHDLVIDPSDGSASFNWTTPWVFDGSFGNAIQIWFDNSIYERLSSLYDLAADTFRSHFHTGAWIEVAVEGASQDFEIDIGAISLLVGDDEAPPKVYGDLMVLVESMAGDVEGGGGGVVLPDDAADFRWERPTMSSPTTHTVTNVGHQQTFTLSAGTDHIFNIIEQLDDGIQITGGRNVLVLGGAIAISGDWSDVPSDSDVRRRSIYIKDNTGIVHLEGIDIDCGLVECDAIDISGDEGIVQLRYMRLHDINGTFDTFHADGVQIFGGVYEFRAEKCTISSGYQGFYPYNTLSGSQSGGHYLQDVNFIGEDGTPGGALFWSTDQDEYRATDLQNVWLEPSPGKTFASEIRPNSGATNPDYIPVVTSSQATWPGSVSDPVTPSGSRVPAVISGILFNGIPPDGDFCPAGLAGVGYVVPEGGGVVEGGGGGGGDVDSTAFHDESYFADNPDPLPFGLNLDTQTFTADLVGTVAMSSFDAWIAGDDPPRDVVSLTLEPGTWRIGFITDVTNMNPFTSTFEPAYFPDDLNVVSELDSGATPEWVDEGSGRTFGPWNDFSIFSVAGLITDPDYSTTGYSEAFQGGELASRFIFRIRPV